MSPSAPETTPGGNLRALRVLVVDDEPLARDCVRLALRDAADVTVVGECDDGASAVTAIRALRPDVVFLDVQMPGDDGFAVLERVGVARMPAVVFVTAYDTHAIRAFEVHAVDYVLKPFENDRLVAALEHARESLRTRREGELARRLARLLDGWRGTDDGMPATAAPSGADTPPARRFTVRDGDHIHFVPAAAVDWLEADGNYVVLHVGAARHRLRATLHALARELDPGTFVRIHRSTIVNLERVRELQPWYGGDYVAILATGAKLRVSRTHAAPLLRAVW